MSNEVPPLLPEESTFDFVYIVFKSFISIVCLLLFIYITLRVLNHFDTSSKNSTTSNQTEMEKANNPNPIQGVKNNASSLNKDHKENTPGTPSK